VLPTESLAGLIAAEWEAQGEHIVLPDMPATRLAFTAIDRVPAAREATADEAARYAGSDLLCYFAEGPRALVERQTAAWEPILAWAENDLALSFNRAAGVIHCAQPPETLERAGEISTPPG
jgi:chaperone required for assembly of F1-ATPase